MRNGFSVEMTNGYRSDRAADYLLVDPMHYMVWKVKISAGRSTLT